MPTLAEEDMVHFYYLRSDVAYNIDVDNVTEAMHGGYETHAGIGIWDVTLNVKFSIELVPVSGIGNIFFPVVDTSNGSAVELTWMNIGQVHTTMPIDEQWNSGQFITATIGAAFNKWAGILQERVKTNGDIFQLIQPFHIVEYANNFDALLRNNHKTTMGNVLVKGHDSFSLATESLNILAQLGCNLNTFQAPRETALGYSTITSKEDQLQIVDVSVGGSSRETRVQVARWYAAMKQCAEDNVSPANGIVHFVRLVSENCLQDGYAYLYRDRYSVYNVTLSASSYRFFTTEVTVQLQRRVVLDLLDGFSTVDVVVYSLVFLAMVVIMAFFMSAKLHKKRRRVSFEGELLAREAVIQNILLESDKAREQIIDYFYHEKKKDAWTFQRWFHRLMSGEDGWDAQKDVVRDASEGRSTRSAISDNRESSLSASTAGGPWSSTKKGGEKDAPSTLYKDPRFTEDGKVKALDRDQIKKVAARREREERRSARASRQQVSTDSMERSAIAMTVVTSTANPVHEAEETAPKHEIEPKPVEIEPEGRKGEGEEQSKIAKDEGPEQENVKEKEDDDDDGDYIPLGELHDVEAAHNGEEQE